jgi:hypothetical protein
MIETLETKLVFMLPTEKAQPQIDAFVYFAINITGGGTLHPEGRGLWVHEGKIYDEPVRAFEVYANLTDDEHAALIAAFIIFGRETKQHSVAYITENKMVVVEVLGSDK